MFMTFPTFDSRSLNLTSGKIFTLQFINIILQFNYLFAFLIGLLRVLTAFSHLDLKVDSNMFEII